MAELTRQQPTPRAALRFDPSFRPALEPYLPTQEELAGSGDLPVITLTYATSLDAQLSLSPGVQTALSGQETKAMTHYLRARHQGIMIGVGTAEADDPTLDCRLEELVSEGLTELDGHKIGHPRPIILDLRGRWQVRQSSKVIIASTQRGKGQGPLIVTTEEGRAEYKSSERYQTIIDAHGSFCTVQSGTDSGTLRWLSIFQAIKLEGIKSVMIEGGGKVIRSILEDVDARRRVNSIIITIAPVWLGVGGVSTTPERGLDKQDKPVVRLTDTKWVQMGQDVVLCGFPQLSMF